MRLYLPIFVLAVLAAGFAAFSVTFGAIAGPKRWNRAKLEAYECGIEPTPQPTARRPVPGQVLPDRDAVHRVRHRDHLPVPVGGRLRQARRCSAWSRWSLFIVTVLVAYAYVWRRGGLELGLSHGYRREAAQRRPADHRSRSSSGWARKALALAGHLRPGLLRHRDDGQTGGPQHDLARFGMERSSGHAAAGRPDDRGRPGQPEDGPGAAADLRPDGRARSGCISMGVCASSGGMFNNYAIVQGVDHIVPVDIYLPGCPPRPEMLIDAILKLHDKIQQHEARQRTASARSPSWRTPARPGRAAPDLPMVTAVSGRRATR